MLDRNDAIVKLLIAEEGWKTEPYKDSRGFWTIGVGHLIDSRQGGVIPTYVRSFPVSDPLVSRMLEEDINIKKVELSRMLPWTASLDLPRYNVFLSMAFQMGLPRLSGFRKMLAAAQNGDWVTAAVEGRDSPWRKVQTPARAERLMQVLETGKEDV